MQAHAAKSKQDLSAREQYAESRLEDVVVVTPNKPLIGRTFARYAASSLACPTYLLWIMLESAGKAGWHIPSRWCLPDPCRLQQLLQLPV